MKILCIGAGSMGRRRLRDLTYLNAGNVILFEPDARRCHEIAAAFGVTGFTSLEEALAQKPDALSISTPPALHEPYVRKALELKLHVFAEVPFILDAENYARIVEQTPGFPAVLAPSHSIRYYPPYRLIHDLLQSKSIGQPLYLEYSLGNYLPDWHPYEDYRHFYASDVRLGGAGMDMILHEVSAMQWWLGNVESVYARLNKLSALEIQGPDSHDVLLTFANGARGFFHNDLLERGSMGRHIRIVGDMGTIEWHQNLSTVRLYQALNSQQTEVPFSAASDWDAALEASREVGRILARQQASSGQNRWDQTDSFSYESCYLREMKHFLEAAQGVRPYTMLSVAAELQTVRTFQAVVQSSQEQREIRVETGN